MNDAHILIVGLHGMLARAFQGLLAAHDIHATHVGLPQVDLAEPSSISEISARDVTHVVNCAAWTDVDGAEAEEDHATRVNALGAADLAAWAHDHNAQFIHFSTDYVFGGTATAPYPVDAPIQPLGAYGRSKALGERLVLETAPDALIVRTSWVYAPWGRNFPLTIARLAADRASLKVVNDQTGRPTSAEHLARVTLGLMLRDCTGPYHVCDGGVCTWFDMASFIVEHTGARCTVEPCTTEEFPRPAPRPPYSVLDLSKTEQLLGPMPLWQDNLTDVLRRVVE